MKIEAKTEESEESKELRALKLLLRESQAQLDSMIEIAEGIEEDNKDFCRNWDYDIKDIYGMDKLEWNHYKERIGKERLEKMNKLINLSKLSKKLSALIQEYFLCL